MKTLYTSCYGRAKSFPKDALQVQTSHGAPDWWKPQTWNGLKRQEVFLKPKHMKDEGGKTWQQHYREQLDELFQSGALKRIVDGLPEGALLLCFEADQKDCHRGVLAAYLNEKGLASVKEFGAEKNDLQMALL